MSASNARLALFAGLALLLAATRLNHFAAVPDASWAVFFAGGFYLRGQVRWAFPLLLALAVAVDVVVITGSGLDFWSHYCVSPGYWLLAPAYFSLWAGGTWFAARRLPALPQLGALALAVTVSVALCQLFAQGGFYWFSDVVAHPTVAGWAQNYADWVLPYWLTTVQYVAIMTVLHIGVGALRRQTGERLLARR